MKANRLIRLSLAALVTLVVASPALAHNWGCWKQPNRTVKYKNTASNSSQAQAAINEWDVDTTLIMSSSSSPEITVSDGNYGNTGWGGLATIVNYSGCNILYGTAVVNTYYSYTSNGKRGVFCQEVGHLFGLDHSNDGGCMGGGYFYSIDTYYTVVSHNITDISNKYAGVPALTEPSDVDARHGEVDNEGEHELVHAVWFNNPMTLGDVTNLASNIVVAKVSAVNEGADIVVLNDGHPNGEHRIPTQSITLEVKSALKGETKKTIELFKTGNEDFVLDGDSSYAVGQTYVLFLTQREDGQYLVVSPEGRYEIGRGGRLTAASSKEFAVKMQNVGLQGLTLDVNEAISK